VSRSAKLLPMFWPMVHLVLAFCGVVVLGVLAVRVGLEVRRLSLAVGDSAARIGRAADDLERAAGPLAARSTVLHRKPATGHRPGR
jgi:hypothetical protein